MKQRIAAIALLLIMTVFLTGGCDAMGQREKYQGAQLVSYAKSLSAVTHGFTRSVHEKNTVSLSDDGSQAIISVERYLAGPGCERSETEARALAVDKSLLAEIAAIVFKDSLYSAKIGEVSPNVVQDGPVISYHFRYREEGLSFVLSNGNELTDNAYGSLGKIDELINDYTDKGKLIQTEKEPQKRKKQNFCPECGGKLTEGDKFCRGCGGRGC